jgi:two-component system, cell cycle response regulator
MPDTDIGRAYQVAERLRACIAAEPFEINDHVSLSVTASVGIATFERDRDTPTTFFKRADQALYAAKREGRNRVVSDAA